MVWGYGKEGKEGDRPAGNDKWVMSSLEGDDKNMEVARSSSSKS